MIGVDRELLVVHDVAGFDALERPWRALLARAERASLFMSFDWHRLGRKARAYLVQKLADRNIRRR